MYGWKSQIGEGRFALQVESDNMEQGKQTERAVDAILVGDELVPVVRCKDCQGYDCKDRLCLTTCCPESPDDFCSHAVRKRHENE